jgi:exosortase
MNEPGSIRLWSARWRLAALERADFVRAAVVALAVALGFVIFHFQGNTTDISKFGRSTLIFMVKRWSENLDIGSDYSHGWIIPIVTIWLLWRDRRGLADAPKQRSWAGLAVVVFALLMHWVGAKAQQTRISLLALVVLFWGAPFFLYGWDLAKRIAFPVGYLIFCVPLAFLDNLTFPLRIVSTNIATLVLNGLGIQAIQSGSRIFGASGNFDMDVADPCSGIRSLMAMSALTSVYAYLSHLPGRLKLLLFACCVPLAMLANVLRLTVTGLSGELFGKTVGNYVHEFSGYISFVVALFLMMSLESWLLRLGRRRESAWAANT